MIFKIGQLLKVLKPMGNKEGNKLWITKGDIVQVIGIYPHHILVERLKPGKDGWRPRQSYCLNGIARDLEVYG